MGCKSARIGQTSLSVGAPKICAPLMGRSPEDFAAEAALAEEAGADLLEIRLDSADPKKSRAICAAVRAVSPLPRILTYRSRRDGGAGEDDPARYAQILFRLAEEGACEALDVELSCGASFASLCGAARRHGMCVIGSFHDFQATADDARLQAILREEAEHADIAKLAVMPRDRFDVVRLCAVALSAAQVLPVPIIAIAMGALGMPTRLSPQMAGSCLTFASAGSPSAPGQIGVREMKQILALQGR